jgi:hypothetical protein
LFLLKLGIGASLLNSALRCIEIAASTFKRPRVEVNITMTSSRNQGIRSEWKIPKNEASQVVPIFFVCSECTTVQEVHRVEIEQSEGGWITQDRMVECQTSLQDLPEKGFCLGDLIEDLE